MISLRDRSGMYPIDKFAPQTKQPIQHADSFERTLSQNSQYVTLTTPPQGCLKSQGSVE